MQKYTKQSEFGKPTDKSSDMPKTSFNHEMMGRPITGIHGSSIKEHNAKYGIFGSEGVGEHFGRSGSPKGKSPRI